MVDDVQQNAQADHRYHRDEQADGLDFYAAHSDDAGQERNLREIHGTATENIVSQIFQQEGSADSGNQYRILWRVPQGTVG